MLVMKLENWKTLVKVAVHKCTGACEWYEKRHLRSAKCDRACHSQSVCNAVVRIMVWTHTHARVRTHMHTYTYAHTHMHTFQ
jgi:hypothetical protein